MLSVKNYQSNLKYYYGDVYKRQELLDRLGIGADNFSTQLAKCTTDAEKQNLALQTLADAGLNDSYKGWAENNKELVDYENSTIDLQLALSQLAKSIAPIVSDLSLIHN